MYSYFSQGFPLNFLTFTSSVVVEPESRLTVTEEASWSVDTEFGAASVLNQTLIHSTLVLGLIFPISAIVLLIADAVEGETESGTTLELCLAITIRARRMVSCRSYKIKYGMEYVQYIS